MSIKIAINGFGRIGRMVARVIFDTKDVELVAINDPAGIDISMQLLKYDSIHKAFRYEIKNKTDDSVEINNKKIKFYNFTDPNKLDFAKDNADVVLECSGLFLTAKEVSHHIKKGVKKVIISAPANDDTPTFVLGVNEKNYKSQNIISNASCTTNCLAPIAKIMDEVFGIEKGLMTTVHSYTNDQNVLDSKHEKDTRRARASAINIIPTTTGAAKAVYKVLPSMEGKLHGQSLRVPVPDVSMMDLNLVLKRNTTQKEVIELLNKASQNELNGIILIDKDKRVSSDFYGCPYSSVIAEDLIQVIGGNLVKIMAWYDNECGYSNRLVDMVKYISKF